MFKTFLQRLFYSEISDINEDKQSMENPIVYLSTFEPLIFGFELIEWEQGDKYVGEEIESEGNER